jgi:hypothetical protein
MAGKYQMKDYIPYPRLHCPSFFVHIAAMLIQGEEIMNSEDLFVKLHPRRPRKRQKGEFPVGKVPCLLYVYAVL